MLRRRPSARTGHSWSAIDPPRGSPACFPPSPPRQPSSIGEGRSPPTQPHPRVEADSAVPQHLPAPPANLSARRPPRPPHRAGYRGQCPPGRETHCRPRALDNPEMSPSFLDPVRLVISLSDQFIHPSSTEKIPGPKFAGYPQWIGLDVGRLAEAPVTS